MSSSERSGVATLVLLLIFFCSGISALLYQVVWLKYLGFVFGNTVYAAATLIAIFLAGLGIGGELFSRSFLRRSPIVVYALIEALIGAVGAFSPNGFSLLDHVYVAAFRSLGDTPALLGVARALFAALFLLPPTILMGGTLPLLVRWLNARKNGRGRAISSLYAANTFGACAGVALAGFFLIPLIGLLSTIFVAVVVNFALAAISVFIGFRARSSGENVSDETRAPDTSATLPVGGSGARWIAFAALLMGFTSIADEVFWTRILVLHLGSSVYAYSLMLFCFLIGLAIGSAIIYLIIDGADLRRTLALLQIAIAVVLALQVHYFVRFADVLEWFARVYGPGGSLRTLAIFLSAVLTAILPPTILMGATFPVTVRLFADATGRAESRSVGIIYLFNTIGSILGSLGAGFFLIRSVGSQNGLFLTAAINACLAVGLLFWMRQRQPEVEGQMSPATLATVTGGLAVLIAAFALSRPDQVLLSAGLFADSKAKVLMFREDVSATVTLRLLARDYYSLELNGVNVAGTSPELIGTQKLQGHLPLLMHPGARKVLHIGFGSGGTAYAVSTHPVEQIRIAEISPEVLDASNRYLRVVNHGVLDDPRVRVEINDGRNFVLATPEKFDVILSDSIHPRYAGNGSLYSKDYFELCKARLNPNGIVSMWLPTYSLTTRNYLMILRAFRDVFPNTTVWYIPNHLNAFTIVIGRTEAGPIAIPRMLSKVTPTVRRELEEIGIRSVSDLTSSLLIGPEGVAAMTLRVEPHVDDRPAVEYESGRLFDRDRSWLRNFVMLSRAVTPLSRSFSGVDPEGLLNAERMREARNRRHVSELVREIRKQR